MTISYSLTNQIDFRVHRLFYLLCCGREQQRHSDLIYSRTHRIPRNRGYSHGLGYFDCAFASGIGSKIISIVNPALAKLLTYCSNGLWTWVVIYSSMLIEGYLERSFDDDVLFVAEPLS